MEYARLPWANTHIPKWRLLRECVCVCVCEYVNAILWGTECNCNIPCGVLFLCGVQNMYPTIFCVKLFPRCHLPPIIRSPRNTSQNFFWKCVYFNTLFKLYTPPRTHVPHKEYYSFTQYPIRVQMSTQPKEYIKCWQKIPHKVVPHKIAFVDICVCVCVCTCKGWLPRTFTTL